MSNPTLFLLPTEEKFDGANWTSFKTTITEAARGRGLLEYLEGKIENPATVKAESKGTQPTPTATTTWWGSPNPTVEEWAQRDAYARSMIILNVINPIGAGVKLDGTAAEAWSSLTTLHDAKTDLGLLQAEEELNSIKYREGANIEAHFRALRTAWSKANDQGAGIDDKRFRAYIIKSMPSSWAPVTGALFEVKKSADVIVRLTTHALLLHGPSVIAPTNSTHALYTQSVRSNDKAIKCENPNCGRTGHTKDKCFRKGGGMEGQYPEWWRKHKGTANTSSATSSATPAAPQANSATATPADNATNNRCLAFTTLTQAPNSDRVATYADSGASRHFFVDRADFITYEPPSPSDAAAVTAEGRTFRVIGCGRVRKWVNLNGESIEITLDDALHAPDLAHNLVSLGCLVRKGVKIELEKGGAVMRAPDNVPFLKCKLEGAMFLIEFARPPAALLARSLSRPTDFETWHRRLAHTSEGTLRDMIRCNTVNGLTVTKMTTNGKCEDCIMGKHARRPFDAQVDPESAPYERVAFDVWGPARVQTTGGKTLMLVATDQGGAECTVWFLANKAAETTLACMEMFDVRAETQWGRRVKIVRTDGGTEFKNELWDKYCQRRGIVHETTAPHSSPANGVAERRNRTILDLARSMLSDSRLPAHYWGEAAATAAHVLDLVPSSRHPGKTPHEIRTGTKPDVSYLRPFGCTAYAKVPREEGGSKLDMRSVKAVLVGYFGMGDYKLLERGSGRMFRSRDVIFEEGVAHRTLPGDHGETPSDLFEILDAQPEVTDTDHQPDTATPITRDVDTDRVPDTVPRRSTRLAAKIADPSPQAADSHALDDEPESEEETYASMPGAMSTDVRDPDELWVPRSFSEAMRRPDLWKGPMDQEMARMHERKVWRLVERPAGARTMKNRWTFALKYDSNGNITGRKARLVAKGFSQIPGVDYFATYASVVKYDSLRMNLAVGTVLDFGMWQIDYTSAYLNAPTQVPILMEQPEGYEVRPSEVYRVDVNTGERVRGSARGEADDEKSLVSLLDKAIYGTMDGANNWWRALDDDMKRLGYKRSDADQSVRSRHRNGETTITSTYTDDTSGMSTSKAEAEAARKELGERYDIKDMGDIKFVLGIRVTRDRERKITTLDQEEYLKRTLEKFGMAECTPKYTPLPPGLVLSRTQAPATKEDRLYMKDKPYCEALGSLMYAQIGTRPDIAFAITSLSRFMSNPGKPHWLALLHVFRYIKGTLGYRIRYGGPDHENYIPRGYYDSDFAADIDTRKSVSGGVYLQAGGPTCWGAKFQDTVATSTTEAEYIALARAGEHIQWMHSALTEIGLGVPPPASLKGDNTGSIAIAENKRNHNRVKHIDVKYHYIRHATEEGKITIDYVPSTDNPADLFTKPLPRPQHHKLCVALRLCE